MQYCSYQVKTNSRNVKLGLLGDLQKYHPCFVPWLWRKYKLDFFHDQETHFLGVGDYFDTFRPTIRERVDVAMTGDKESRYQIERPIMKNVQAFAEELEPIRGRIIGLLEGHHYFKMADGQTSTQYLCQLLKVPYLGFAAFINMHIERSGRDRNLVKIMATHGEGGGEGIASDFARIEKKLVPCWDADIYVRAHSTKIGAGYASDLNHITERNGVMEKRPKHRLMLNNGGFLDGYKTGVSSYVEQANMKPAALGWAWANIHLGKRGREISGTVFAP